SPTRMYFHALRMSQSDMTTQFSVLSSSPSWGESIVPSPVSRLVLQGSSSGFTEASAPSLHQVLMKLNEIVDIFLAHFCELGRGRVAGALQLESWEYSALLAVNVE